MSDSDPIALLKTIEAKTLYMNLFPVCLALLGYDYILTLPSEINLVWHSKWNTIKVAFLIQRYLAFLDAVLLGVAAFGRFGPEGVEGCRIVNGLALVILGLGMCSSEVILTFRVWAVCGKSPALKIILITLYILCWGSALVVAVIISVHQPLVIISSSSSPSIIPFENLCVQITPIALAGVAAILFVAYDFVLCGIMAWKGWIFYQTAVRMRVPPPRARGEEVEHFHVQAPASQRGRRLHLFNAVYRDGFIYYLYIFGVMIITFTILITLQGIKPGVLGAIAAWLLFVTRYLHSIITTRVVLNIRGAKATSSLEGSRSYGTSSGRS